MPQIYLVAACALWVLASLRFIREDERLVIFRLSRFIGFRGPGIVLTLLFMDKSQKIRIGDTGIMSTPDLAEIRGLKIPVHAASPLYPMDRVDIDNFVNTDIDTKVMVKKSHGAA